MSKLSDLKTVCRMAFRTIKGRDDAERLESFYNGQAEDYDAFRNKFLSGRRELWETLGADAVDGGVWVDMGGGTGMNLHYFGADISRWKKIYVVDLSPSMLKVADERIRRNGWTNVETVCADATKWAPPEGAADVVAFSYSLCMIPDWFAALDRAFETLKPGGKIGVVDFYVARKRPADGFPKQRWSTRVFWPIWFAFDDVFLSADYAPYLANKFERLSFAQWNDRIPYFPIPWSKTPRYSFVGRKAG